MRCWTAQRSLFTALGCHPTTAGGAHFCLLCCQPGPVHESLPARPPRLTPRRPCSPPVWLGHPIHTASRTCDGPQRFISQVPFRGTGRHEPPQRQSLCSNSDSTLTHRMTLTNPITHPHVWHTNKEACQPVGNFFVLFRLAQSLRFLLGRGPHKNCKNDLDDQT